jgi:hypothetical protein
VQSARRSPIGGKILLTSITRKPLKTPQRSHCWHWQCFGIVTLTLKSSWSGYLLINILRIAALMSNLRPEKLHVKFIGDSDPEGPKSPRKYTLTHSDISGDLFLSVGTEYDHDAISGFYTRMMRDEVLAEYLQGNDGPELHVYCHVSGGLVVGSASWRYAIFQQHLRQVLQAFHHGDEVFLTANLEINNAPVIVHFHSTNRRYNLTERWGYLPNYQLTEV